MADDDDKGGFGPIDFFFKPVYVVPLLVVTGVSAIALFAPERFLVSVGAVDLRNKYRIWVGPLFVVSSVYLLISLGWKISKHVLHHFNHERREAKWKQHVRERIVGATPIEKGLLYEFLRQNKRAILLDRFNPTVMSLRAAGFLIVENHPARTQFSADGTLIVPTVHHIADDVWTLIHAEDHLLG